MPNLGTRDDWRKTKERFGIPDGVCKFSMGEKLGAFAKAEAATADIHAKVTLWEGLVVTVTTYEKALKAMKPDKFKGKTASEKQASFNKAKEELKSMLSQAQSMLGMLKMQQNPLKHVSDYLGEVTGKFNSLDRTDLGAVSTFYSQELRNTLGLAIHSALKDGLRPDIKAAFQKYEQYLEAVNKDLNKPAQNDPNAIATTLGKALKVITDLHL